MAGATKLLTSGGGGVILTPGTNIASDVTVNLPTTNGITLVGGANGIAPEASGGTGTTTGYYGFKNRIINGDMKIDQRNAGAAVTVTIGSSSSTFSCDRLKLTNQTDGAYTAQQSTNVPAGFINSVLITSTVADASIGSSQYAQIEQRIEGNNISDLNWGTANAQTVTLSFWVKSNLTGTFCATLYNSNGSRCYVSTYTINSANTWERKTITVAGDTSGTWQTGTSIGIDVIFCLAVGSAYQQAAGSWGTTSFAIGTSGQTNFMANTGNTFYITGVQLEKGSIATSFDFRPYGTELALCQRYFETNYNEGQAVGSNSGFNGAWVAVAINGSDFYDFGRTTFAVTKRTSPTINQYNPTTGSGNYYDFSTSGANGNVGARHSGTAGFSQYASTAFSASHAYAIRWTASAEL